MVQSKDKNKSYLNKQEKRKPLNTRETTLELQQTFHVISY